jgi:hypothetical protein
MNVTVICHLKGVFVTIFECERKKGEYYCDPKMSILVKLQFIGAFNVGSIYGVLNMDLRYKHSLIFG